MRKIEFRGRTTSENKWIYGYFSGIYETEDGVVGCIKDYKGKDNLVKLETLGQYTGLNDKNGKKIFEGDIMSISPISPKYEIKWDNEQQRFCFWNDGWASGFNGFITSYEIIGNIHDNPELLEVEK